MKKFINIFLAVVAGLAIGSLVNIGIIMISHYIIPTPAGANVSSMENLKATMHLFEPKHFIFPFLAHALGTLVGALVTARIVLENKMKFALIIGIVFLILGTINVLALPAPLWYNALDLCLAYLPMAYIGGKIALKK